ncbi:hypothetical protein KY284_034480 [Solanum tuberosum]|nr:hypothetical protein KY284_034480 [Solanum tuberosum]
MGNPIPIYEDSGSVSAPSSQQRQLQLQHRRRDRSFHYGPHQHLLIVTKATVVSVRGAQEFAILVENRASL